MSVLLENVSKIVRIEGKPRVLFDGLNLQVGRTDRVGVLALPKSGKTTLVRLVCGTQRPDGGRISRIGRISWPIPMGDYIVPRSSLAWNIRSVARMYGVKDPGFCRKIAKLAGLEDFLNLPLANAPSYARQQFAFAFGIGMDFDLYLFDNLIVPQRKEFKERAAEALRERMEGKAILLVTSLPQAVADWCDSSYVLEYGRVTHFPDVNEGVEYFKALQKAEKERKGLEGQQKQEDGEDGASEEDQRSVEVVGAALSDF